MSSTLLLWTLHVLIFETLAGVVNERDNLGRIERVLNFTEAAAEHGYRSEEHTVVTEDGYVITIFRLPKGKNCKEAVRRPPILMMHGLLVSAHSWIDSGPSSGLGYLLADGCCDVWLTNARGNLYSRRHLTLNPDRDPEFWQFSLHEVGIYDLPATIDYMLSYTRSERVNYIGFSQGGSALFIMCSERPSLCNNIGFSLLLHPASKMIHTESAFFRLSFKIYETIEPYLHSALDLEALSYGSYLQKIIANLCQDYQNANTLCRAGLSLIDSMHPGSIAASTIRAVTAHSPAGTSVKTLSWFSQALDADNFRNFDYGCDRNLKIYGKPNPPVYNINMTKMPILIIHGKNDNIVSWRDVEWMKVQLPNVLEMFYVEDSLWNHLDPLFSRHTRKAIYPKIIEYLLKYTISP